MNKNKFFLGLTTVSLAMVAGVGIASVSHNVDFNKFAKATGDVHSPRTIDLRNASYRTETMGGGGMTGYFYFYDDNTNSDWPVSIILGMEIVPDGDDPVGINVDGNGITLAPNDGVRNRPNCDAHGNDIHDQYANITSISANYSGEGLVLNADLWSWDYDGEQEQYFFNQHSVLNEYSLATNEEKSFAGTLPNSFILTNKGEGNIIIQSITIAFNC